jgi:hypothetical protein
LDSQDLEYGEQAVRVGKVSFDRASASWGTLASATDEKRRRSRLGKGLLTQLLAGP